MKRLFTFFLFALITSSSLVFGQGVTIGSNNAPDPSAALDVQSNSKGLLLPRLTTVQRNAIVSPAQGLMIFNTDVACFEGWTGSGWVSMGCCSPLPIAPSNVTAVGGNSQATITFSGGTGTSYTVTSNPGGFTATGPSSPLTVTGLSNGVSYTFTVVANNQCGSSAPSTPSNAVTPVGQNIQTFNYTGSLQTFTVPGGVTTLTIEAYGAQGAKNFANNGGVGGLGAHIKGDYTVVPGEVLNVIVGGQGVIGNNSIAGGGGGGGSFIIRTSNTSPLLIAGGGGGASYQGNSGQPGSATQTAGPGGYSSPTIGNGGITDNGGGGGTGGGGGGWNTAGQSNNWSGGGGAQGGTGGTTAYGGVGGYGGGGGSYHGGGGGGGYSGGSGGTYTVGGGGGGSYNIGTNQVNNAGVQTGNGQVILSW